MQDSAMLQADGVQCRTWKQTNHVEFETEVEAMYQGFYTLRKVLQAFPLLCTQGVPGTGKCKKEKCLQCAIQAGEYWSPICPEAFGVKGMN